MRPYSPVYRRLAIARVAAAVISFLLVLGWTWLGPPPSSGLPRWQQERQAANPPVVVAPDQSPGPDHVRNKDQPATPARPYR